MTFLLLSNKRVYFYPTLHLSNKGEHWLPQDFGKQQRSVFTESLENSLSAVLTCHLACRVWASGHFFRRTFWVFVIHRRYDIASLALLWAQSCPTVGSGQPSSGNPLSIRFPFHSHALSLSHLPTTIGALGESSYGNSFCHISPSVALSQVHRGRILP